MLPLGWKMSHFTLITLKSGTSLVPVSDHKWPIDYFNVFYLCITLGNIVILWLTRYSGIFTVVSTLDSCSHVKLNSNRKGIFAHATFVPSNFFLPEYVVFFLVYRGFCFVYVLIFVFQYIGGSRCSYGIRCLGHALDGLPLALCPWHAVLLQYASVSLFIL